MRGHVGAALALQCAVAVRRHVALHVALLCPVEPAASSSSSWQRFTTTSITSCKAFTRAFTPFLVVLALVHPTAYVLSTHGTQPHLSAPVMSCWSLHAGIMMTPRVCRHVCKPSSCHPGPHGHGWAGQAGSTCVRQGAVSLRSPITELACLSRRPHRHMHALCCSSHTALSVGSPATLGMHTHKRNLLQHAVFRGAASHRQHTACLLGNGMST